MSTIKAKYTLTHGDRFHISTAPTDDLDPQTPLAYTDASALIKTVEWQQGARGDIEVTAMLSEGPEFIPGDRAQDQLTLTSNWAESHAAAKKFRESYDDADLYAFKLEHADGEITEWLGYVGQLSISNPLKSVSSANITIKLSGAPKHTDA